MKTRDCPRCKHHSLFPNGAFWACGMCPAIGRSVTRHTSLRPRFTGSERTPVINRHHHCVREELGVLISLVLSLGMILLTIFGVWLWRIFEQIREAAVAMTSIGIP